MANLNLNIEEEIVVLKKYHLSPAELFLLRLLLIAQDDIEDNNGLPSIYNYLELDEECRGSFLGTLLSLQDKGIILKSYKMPKPGDKISNFGDFIFEIPINKNVTKQIYKSAYEMGVEMFNHYPQWGIINGKSVALRSVAKKFNSLEDAYRFYGKSIGWNPERHKEIIELLDWAKENEVINFSISTFLINHSWLDLQDMRDGKVSNVTIDSFTDI